ncbi:gliding motility protein GldN [Flavobacterium sp. J49]|uniref:type IX secretion system ring protein PorN/GldN n=1 Tax=Flavobacterium sp. J49 TaxID=2718534 RepID=UPI00159391ED|nr:gliding motility protein GldN [Flavobacterium sp. J49]MBF6640526.1 gliding motility protein GldN [Flavobacterium sp. J49]NIC01773.1 gliding motility protein GldN [Flavobacterium sp. J49]
MKIRNLLLIAFAVLISANSFAQSNLLNAKVPDEIGKKTPAQLISDNDKPLPYGYVHDRDVLMGKTIWEFIDVDERINFPLYYPIDTAFVGKERRSLFDVLIKNIKSGKITEVYSDDYFNIKKTYKDMESSFSFVDTIPAGKDYINDHYDEFYPKSTTQRVKVNGKWVTQEVPAAPAAVLDPQYINKKELDASYISGYKIKGYWYFDKRQGELKYRLLALCPVTPEARDAGNDNADVIDLFWVYFPAVRDVLHEAKAFNDKNSAMPITFDHLLNSRRFSGEIYKEENVYGDREIQQYMKDNSQMQLLEAERIKEKIRSFESDMWNY